MKITNAKTFLVEGIKYNWTLLKIETDAGLHDWGEATNWPGSPLIEAACQHVGQFITGLDARQIDFIWTKIYRDITIEFTIGGHTNEPTNFPRSTGHITGKTDGAVPDAHADAIGRIGATRARHDSRFRD